MADANLLKDLREDLVTCYKDSVSTIPISPVRDDLGVPLEQLYVQPQLSVNATHIFGQRGSANSNETVNSYKEIFFGKQNSPYKHIYISANAGMGKTSFARKVTLTWCEALKPGNNTNGFFDREDLETVKHFDIIFYLELPHMKKCDIADMISDFIESRLPRSFQYTKPFIERVLNTKKCLVILDGLDQWTHPESCQRKGVPHNRYIKNVTVMTTTRPWKMSEMRLSTNQVDRHLELLDLTRRTAQDLEANAIRLLKSHNDPKSVGRDVDKFDDLIDKAELNEIQRKPYILLQLVCIWADGRPIGRSRFEAYCNIIALNIERREFQRSRETRATRAAVDYIVPEYMQNNPLLAENICKFLKVGELGLVALCEELKAPAYIFDKKLALKYLTSDELEFFAETGILSFTKDTKIISERREIVTFQHKAIEEFFVALFMASVWKSRAKRRIILLKCRSLPDLFEASFINVMNLVKDINNDTYKDMYKRITDKESAVASDDIRLYGSRLTRISEEESVQIVEDCVDEKQCFAEGSFGKLFKSDGLKTRCGITVAVKKIQDERQLDDIPNTVKKEMNVSKVLHPFLLPLIAVIREVDEGRNTFYLISPFCEQGDLYTVLHTKKTPLNQVQRIRIVLQIALGIQHLHTFVEGVKDVIIHKDICSDNIILDGRQNARLIDFGLARDKGDDTNTISKRIHYSHPDVGTGREATEFWDYFSFGVVIRELLTGLPPEGKKETNLFLKKMKLKDVLDNSDQKVWPEDYDTHKHLNKIAESCLQPQSTFSFQRDVVEKIQSIFKQAVWVPEKGVTPQCAQCMINPATSKAAEKMHTSNCKEAFGLCVPCEKRSILCPVKCYGCGETLKPVIGKDWAALLVAGNDTTDKQIAEAFKSDVENMEKVVTSKTPLIMGISKENVYVIIPKAPGTPEELLPRIKTAMKEIKESSSHTLVVYFSCHGKTIVKGKENNSFQLGSEKELLPTIEFQKLFEQDEKTGKIQKVILFMDRCFPTKINVDKNDIVKAIQLNACESNKTALVKNQASIFTKHLIEGLKAWHCKNKDTKKSASDDYITATVIQEYTNECMKVDDRKPVMFCSGPIHSDDFKIAYDTAEDVDVEFTDGKDGKDRKSLSVDLCQKMEDLKNAIKKLFNKEVDKYDVQIQKDTHRNKDRYVDCTTVETIMTACVLRQPLIVKFPEFSDHAKPKQEEKQFNICKEQATRKRKNEEQS